MRKCKIKLIIKGKFTNAVIVCTFEIIDGTMPVSKQEKLYYNCGITAYETQKKSMLEQTSHSQQFMITGTVKHAKATPMLTAAHKQKRVEWANTHINDD